jgi:hypothetical protein
MKLLRIKKAFDVCVGAGVFNPTDLLPEMTSKRTKVFDGQIIFS